MQTGSAQHFSKAFCKSRFACNQPDNPEHWAAFCQECTEESTCRLMQQSCDLVLQKGKNERATTERDWSIGMLKRYSLEELPPPR